MTKMEYAELIAKEVKGKVKEVEKANGVKLVGIQMGEEDIRPIVYIDQFYDQLYLVEDAAREVLEMANIKTDFDLNDFAKFDKVKSKIRFRLYNDATNAEVFKSAKEFGFDDLILVPVVENIVKNGSVTIKKSHLKIWGVTADEVLEVAKANSIPGEYEITSMEDILAAFGVEIEDYPQTPLFVVTNKQKCFGSYGVIALREQLKNMFPDGYMVIPSSIHEVLVMPLDVDNNSEINGIIGQVNTEQVAPEERLGSHYYVFN